MTARMTARYGLAAALLLLGAAPGRAATLLCARPEVLQQVAQTVRQWNVYNAVEAGSVQEAPTAFANAVVCHAVISGIGYAATQAGWEPRVTRELRRYDVEVRNNRVFVQVPR